MYCTTLPPRKQAFVGKFLQEKDIVNFRSKFLGRKAVIGIGIHKKNSLVETTAPFATKSRQYALLHAVIVSYVQLVESDDVFVEVVTYASKVAYLAIAVNR